MIPRYQRILFYVLAAGSLLMLILLIRGCMHDQTRVAGLRDQSPIAAPSDMPDEQVSIAAANDADGTITLDTISLPLPADASGRANTLLARALANDALPASNHPLPAVPAITNVFLLSLPLRNAAADDADQIPHNDVNDPATRLLAVVNLTADFAARHPSGVLTEDLTLRQIIATLQANFSQIDEVEFLVGGKPVETLAGHADLRRAYPVAEPAKAIHVLGADGRTL